MERKKKTLINYTLFKSYLIFILLLLVPLNSYCQAGYERKINMDQAIEMAFRNNPMAKNTEYKLQSAIIQKGNLLKLAPTSFQYRYGQLYSAQNDRYFEITQSFGSVPGYFLKKEKYNHEVKLAGIEQQIELNNLKIQIKTAWFRWIHAYEKKSIEQKEISIIEKYIKKEIDSLLVYDSITLEQFELQTRYAEFQNRFFQVEENYQYITNELHKLLFTDEILSPADTSMHLYSINVLSDGDEKFLPVLKISYYSELKNLKNTELKNEQLNFFPEINLGYFNQEIQHYKGFNGIMLGLSLPIWYFPQKTKIKTAKVEQIIANNELEYQKFVLQKNIENLKIKLDQIFVQISYYRENELRLSRIMENSAIEQFTKGRSGSLEFIHIIQSVYKTRFDYLDKLLDYNLTALELENYIN